MQLYEWPIDESILSYSGQYGYGIWMKYQPYVIENPNVVYSYALVEMNPSNYFIYSEQTTTKQQQTLLLTLEIDKIQQHIIYHLSIKTANDYNIQDISIDPLKYEGRWLLFFAYYDLDNKQSYITFYNYGEKYLIQQLVFNDYPMLSAKMRYTVGGTYNQDGVQSFSQFPGRLTQWFTTGNIDLINSLGLCQPLDSSYEFVQLLTEQIDTIEILKGEKYDSYTYDTRVDCKKLEVKGWVKLDPLTFDSEDVETTVIRITINYKLSDDSYLGDKFLYIKYYQSNILQNNWISVTTYSYQFPVKDPYTSDHSDSVIKLNAFLQNAVTEWHYFRFEQNSDGNNNQPIFKMTFPSLGKKVVSKWHKQINYFTAVKFNSFVGGDYSSTQIYFLKGQVYNIFLHACYNQEEEFKAQCHYSCKSCLGPLLTQCFDCLENSNRIYQESQMNCICKLGFMDINQNPICDAILTIYPQLTLLEIEKGCNVDGYNDCKNIACSIGYFKFEDQCIRCPEQREGTSQIMQLCGDCYLFSNNFLQQCTFDLIAYNLSEENAYLQQMRAAEDISFYDIKRYPTGEYYLSLCYGCLNSYSCKNTYYRLDNECFKCAEGCQTCQNQISCDSCLDSYVMTSINQCILCSPNCISCVESKSPSLQPTCIACENSYFLDQQNECKQCGEFCTSCNMQRCFTCINNTDYFITLDGFNCAKCQITNCKYCYQYYPSDKGIEALTLDLDFIQISVTSYPLYTGCAYCQNNYFYNPQTLQCENIGVYQSSAQAGGISLNPNSSVNPNAYYCLTGIITQDNTKVCLIHSSYDPTAIQNTYCVTLSSCSSCIVGSSNNFSYCAICKNGYYTLLSKGICQPCPIQCVTCAQQHVHYHDLWKKEIMAFYQYFINSNSNHYYTKYVVSEDSSDYEVICTSCMKGQILYKNNCIQDCNESCLDCQIIDGVAKCVKCPPTQFGLLRSVDFKNLNCIQCPNFCQACLDSTRYANPWFVNPFYEGDLKYTNICYREYKYIDDVLLFNDNQLGVLTTCKKYEKCSNTLLIQYDVYCDQVDLNNAILANTPNSIKLSIDKLQTSGFDSLNKQGFFQYLNQITVTNVTFQLNIIPGTINECSLAKDISIQLFQNVYALQHQELLFTSSRQVPLTILREIRLENFTKITFNNVLFMNTKQGNPQKLILSSSHKPVDFSLLNVNIASNQLSFISSQARKVYFENITIIGVNMISNYLFALNPLTIVILAEFSLVANKIQILDSKLINSFIFYLLCFEGGGNSSTILDTITINNSQFTYSTIITTNFSQQNTCGVISLSNMNIQLSQIAYSSLIDTPGAFDMTVTGITVNCCQISQSILLALNIVNVMSFKIATSLIMNSVIITNQVQSTSFVDALTRSAKLYMENMIFQDNVYNNSKAFINLQKKTSNNTIITIKNLVLLNNRINDAIASSDVSDVSYEDALITFSCDQLQIDGLNIKRAYGYPELSFRNISQIMLQNGDIAIEPQYWTKILQPSVSCIEKNLNKLQGFVLYIDGYQYVEFINVTSHDMLLINYPLIIIKSKDIMEAIQVDIVNIINSQFLDNFLLLTKAHRQTSLIFLQSQQELYFTMDNVTFKGNMLNEYIQDLTLLSTATLQIKSISGMNKVLNSNFFANIVTNSTDPILLINSDSIQLIASTFQDNNILNFEKISDKILYSKDNYLSKETILTFFPIYSHGGNGYLIMSSLIMNNITTNNSFGVSAGGFKITAQSETFINIDHSYFNNSQTSIVFSDGSKGGTLYIDGSKAKLIITISNTVIQNSFSRFNGGGIYVDPSKSYNIISFNNVSIINSFALKAMFLNVECSEQIVETQIIFVDCFFTNSEEAFSSFIRRFSDLSTPEIVQIQQNNPMILLLFSDFKMQNCSMDNSFLGFFLDIENSNNIVLDSIRILNPKIFYAPILKFILGKTQRSKLTITSLSIINTRQQPQLNVNPCPSLTQTYHKYDWQCPEISVESNQVFAQSALSSISYGICNFESIFSETSRFNFSLISIQGLSEVSIINIHQVNLVDNNCTYCYFGLIGILFEDGDTQAMDKQIIMSEIIIENNSCGFLGCITIADKEFPLSALEYIPYRRQLEQQNYQQFVANMAFKSLIQRYTCVGNSANYGVCLFAYDNQVIMQDAIIMDNIAFQIGGAIFYYSKNQFQLFQSKIANNSANIGGGIYFTGYFPSNLEDLDVNLLDNTAKVSNNQLKEQPRSLTISIDGGRTLLEKIVIASNATNIVEEIQITPYKILGTDIPFKMIRFPSGQKISKYQYFDSYNYAYIPYNLTFRLIALNKFSQKESQLFDTFCDITPTSVTKEGKVVDSNHTTISIQKIVFNSTTNDYNLDEAIIYFSPFSSDYLVLQFQCNSVKVPVFDSKPPFVIQSFFINYQLNVKIQTFECQVGEYFNATQETCILCQSDQNQYSVNSDASTCSFKDEITMKNIKSTMIELRLGYWRAYTHSETIAGCYHLVENCNGGWKPGDESCTEGHIGALCEQCDLYNTRQKGSFSVSSLYQCGSCSETTINILTIVFISVWTIVSIILSVNSTIKHIETFIIALKVKQYRVQVVTAGSSTAILIKVLTNYLQIISTISTFSLQFPVGIAAAIESVGNPLESMAYSLDCFLILITDIEIIYFRLIWSFVMAFMYIGAFFISYFIMVMMKYQKYNITIISTTLIYMYIYLQPNFMGSLVSLTSYRIISDQRWIQGNVAYRYNSDQHIKWLLFFVLPLLLLLGLIIPLVMFLGVFLNRSKLDRIQNRFKWGYLYNEYKHDAYFWETIKILQKEFIIIGLTFYEDYIPIKASIVFLLLFFYSLATNQVKPYMTVQMNFLDSQSTIFCSVSIVLASTIYMAQSANLNEIIWPCYTMIGAVNGAFILKLIVKIIFEYFDKLHSKIDWFKDVINKRYPTITKKYKFLKYIVDSRQQQQLRVKRRYKLLREHLMKQAKSLIQFKKKWRFELPEPSSHTFNIEGFSVKSSLLVNYQQEKQSIQ